MNYSEMFPVSDNQIDIYKVKDIETLHLWYKQENLETFQEKKDALWKIMGVLAERCDPTETEEENLLGLEEIFFLGYWRILS